MNKSEKNIYTKDQINLTKKLHNEVERNHDLWHEHIKSWEEIVGTSFYVDLSYFARLIIYSIMNNDEKKAKRILDKIEIFLQDSNEESQNIIYLFFEDITNSLGWGDKKYMNKFVRTTFERVL